MSLLADGIKEAVRVCHEASANAGWWRGPHGEDLRDPKHPYGPYIAGTKLALIHSEVSETLEGERKHLPDDKLPHRPMAEVECADTLIRLLDYAGAYNYDLAGAVEEKLAFNAQRADHKAEARAGYGGKKI